MKKPLSFAFAVCILFFFPSTALSSFEIEMKNGTRFITDRYWEEAGMIKFNLYGGVTAFSKDKINSITETDKQPVVITEEPSENDDQAPAMQKDESPSDSVAGEEKELEPPQIEEPQKEQFLSQKDHIDSEIGDVSEALEKARQNNDKKEMRSQRKKMLKLHSNRQSLFEEIKKANGGTPPDWWPTLWPADAEPESE